MAKYVGAEMPRKELLALVGDPAQVARAVPVELRGGKAEGVAAVQVTTGSGLEFTVLPGRGMDIPFASIGGKSLGFFSGAGIASPAYFEEPGLGWLRNSFFGLLTTCGISSCGFPSEHEGKRYGLHGRVSNAGAEDLCVEQDWRGDDYVISVRGKIREACPFGENLRLARSVETRLGWDKFVIRDVIENHGFEPEPLMMLYHFNFGYPVLGPNARVVAPILSKEARDEVAVRDRGIEESQVFPGPIHGYEEKVFFYDLASDAEGNTFAALLNEDIGDGSPLGIVLRFNKKELPRFTHWKMPCEGFYVTGLEPGTAGCRGRGPELERGGVPMLAAQESWPITIELEVLRDLGAFARVRREAETLAASGK